MANNPALQDKIEWAPDDWDYHYVPLTDTHIFVHDLTGHSVIINGDFDIDEMKEYLKEWSNAHS